MKSLGFVSEWYIVKILEFWWGGGGGGDILLETQGVGGGKELWDGKQLGADQEGDEDWTVKKRIKE
jgi:hypothetical protein